MVGDTPLPAALNVRSTFWRLSDCHQQYIVESQTDHLWPFQSRKASQRVVQVFIRRHTTLLYIHQPFLQGISESAGKPFTNSTAYRLIYKSFNPSNNRLTSSSLL